MLSLLVVLTLAAQAPAEGEAPPPPLSSEQPTDPSELAPPPSPSTPPPPSNFPETPPAPPPAPEQPRGEPPGWGTAGSAAAQMGAGVGACCVSGCVTIPCLFVPFVGSIAGNCISGTIIGATETVVGDAVSQKRSAMLWPSVTAIAISIVGGAVNLGLSFALLGSGALVPDLNQPFAPTPFLLASSAVSLVTVTAAIIAPAIVYHLLGVDKEPDDQGGLGFPGIFSPADPTGGRAKREGAVPPAATPTSSTSTSPPPPAAY